MRNGDAYKIKRMFDTGTSVKDIHAKFSRIYTLDEVKAFCPKPELTAAQKGAATKAKNKKSKDDSFLDD